MWLFIFFVAVFWATLCYLIAKKNGRDKNFAILLGMFFGLFAFLGYLIAGKTLKQRVKEAKEIEDAIEGK